MLHEFVDKGGEGYKNPKFFRTSQMEAPRVERDLQREEEEEGYG